MRVIVLAEQITTIRPSPISRHVSEAKQDPSLEGVLVFSGISLLLGAMSVVFSLLNLPSAYLL
jgi:hypothetical protein